MICSKSYSSRGWEWKTDIRLVGGLGVTMWLEMRVVHFLFVLLAAQVPRQRKILWLIPTRLTTLVSRCVFWCSGLPWAIGTGVTWPRRAMGAIGAIKS